MGSDHDKELKKGFRPGKILDHFGNLEWLGRQRFVRGVVGLLVAKRFDEYRPSKTDDAPGYEP